jgi:hypothetical protein
VGGSLRIPYLPAIEAVDQGTLPKELFTSGGYSWNGITKLDLVGALHLLTMAYMRAKIIPVFVVNTFTSDLA